jgi:hypothetical protein
MTRVTGAQCRFYMLPESTYGTAPTGNYIQLGFMEANLGTSQDLTDNPIIGLADDRDPGDPFLGPVDTAGQVTVPINEDGFGHWLRLMFGPPTTSGTNPNFVHTFDSGVLEPPSNAMVLDYTSKLTNRWSVNSGARGGEMAIEFSPTGAAMARFPVICQGESRVASSPVGTPVIVAGANFQRSMGSVQRNGSALGQVVGGDFTYSNNLDAVRTIRADRRIEGADPGIVGVTFNLRLRLSAAAEALLTDAEANTACTLDFRLQRSAQRYVNFNMGRAWLSAPKRPIAGPNGIEATFSGRASVDPATGRTMRVTLGNSVAGTNYA